MELSRYADLFLSESRAHISAINHHLLELERSGEMGEVEEIFRSAHTLKGMSSAMGCTAAAELAHALEHLLDRLRSGGVVIDDSVMEGLFEGTDALEQTIASELAGEGPPGGLSPILARVRLLTGESLDAAVDSFAEAGAEAAAGTEPGSGGGMNVTVLIQAATALPAVRAMLVLRTARQLGEVLEIVPTEEQLLAAEFSGTLSFLLRTEHDPESVRATLLRAGDVAHVVVEEREAAVDQTGVTESDFDPASMADSRAGRGTGHFVRIEQQRLDVLVEHIGELVIARDRLHRLVGETSDPVLQDALDAASRLIGDVRDEVMRMRMAPIGDAFDRFPRFVRDAARSLGKKVDFKVAGRDTPLDRALHTELSDLLIHLLRNALDHGVEAPQDREAAGKPPAATVRLVAERVREQVLVSVEDDGRGIERERVLEAAVATEMLSAGEASALDEQAVLQLLTRPGFSTATEVTDVSGRGVGLDVVASRVRALGGALEIESTPGVGTAFRLRLPLSLAILRTLQVRAAGQVFVIPISAIEEVTELGAGSQVRWHSETEGAFEFREEMVPLIRLGRLLMPAEQPHPELHAPVVVLQLADGLLGLVVDRLQGHHEAVLKPFDAPRDMIQVFAGATILSDGRPALIIDGLKLSAWANLSPRPAALGSAAGRP